MTDQTQAGNGANAGNPGEGPQLAILVQFTKDLSFENPLAPMSLQPRENGPNITMQVNVNARPLSDTDYECSLALEGEARHDKDVAFKFELTYCGVFRLVNFPQEHIGPVVMIECPRLLFPFARRVLTDAIHAGGFPYFQINPIDFASLYQQRMQQAGVQPSA